MAVSKSRRQASRKRAQSSARRRRSFFEQLEVRNLLAADWHNAVMPMDVNGDQVVSPLDALQVVIKLNADGSGQMPSLPPGVQPSGYYDTNADGFLNPLDALLVLIKLEESQAAGSVDTLQQIGVDIVPVDATTFLVAYSQPMGANATDPENYIIKTDDGTVLQVLEAVMAEGESVVELRTAPQSSSSGYTVNIQNVTSQSGQTVFFEGRKLLTGNPKGAVVSVAATSSTRVVVVFNEAMADNALAPQHYSIKDPSGKPLLVTDAQFDGPLGMVVILTTAPQTKVHYNLDVFFVTDLQNDGLDVRNGSFHGIAAPSLLNAVPVSPTRLVLTFTGPIGDSALSPSTYKIEELNASGAPTGVTLPIAQARFLGDQRSIVELTTGSQSAARYRITPTNALTDAAGFPIPANAVEFLGLGGLPKLLGITPSGVNSVLLTFNQAMSDDALSPTSYVIKNAAGNTLNVLSATFVGSERRLVQLFTAPQSPGVYTIQSITATDLGGNKVTVPTGSTGSFQGVPAPSLGGATPTDPTHIILTFGGAVGDSALSPSAYKIEKLDAAGNVVGILPISSAAFVGGQRTVVSLTTGEQSDATYRISTTSALTNADGVPLPIVQLNFTGIPSAPPALVGATSTGPTTLLFTFSLPMSDDALSPSAYVINDASGSPLQLLSAKFVGTERRIVELTTSPQTNQNYTIVSINATSTEGGGETVVVPAIPGISTIAGNETPSESTPVEGPPRVVGAASLSNTTVLVAFSEPMAANALNTAHYFIVQQNVNPEVGYLPILSAAFYSSDQRSVLLTTGSQNELTYAVTAVNVTDVAGNALAPAVLAGGQRIDPSTAMFPGSPPSGVQFVDSDGDGLSDNVEVRGWTVTVTLLNGTTVTREVTSNPGDPTLPVDHPTNVAARDADGDGLWDAQELNIGTDPRSADTDGDQLNDWAEFNEIYSDPTNQDSDGDSLDDFLEFTFFKTSPYLADTDGDQMTDDYEIFANRNPRVSDLPRPEISVGEVSLQLDVRFTETNDQQRRDLETRAITSTLAKSASQSFTRSDTVALEAHIEVGLGDGSTKINAGPFIRAGSSVGYTFDQTSESATETQQAYERSLSTDKEVTRGYTVERTVEGASMSIAVDLRSLSDIAYRVKNLQVTAFIQNPQDHSKLTPVATLLPDSEPEEGFTLGPLVAQKGPFKFTADAIFPNLVESLMANSSGLVFRISNYDIIDENGRNFAFTSQEIVERTSRLVIDYGGASSLRALLGGEAFDELQPGDETEIYRVSTSAGQVIDTNFDGVIDHPLIDDPLIDDDLIEDDRFATFDGSGKEVGITIFEALAAVGLTRYDEAATPTGSLSDEEILSSYSTYMAPAETIGGINYPAREKIHRIRGISNDLINKKYWEVLTPLGIDQVIDLNNLILKTDSPVSLNFVQDLDRDSLSADVEFFLRTSDSLLPNGANAPGGTDYTTDESVTFSTDPGYATGSIVRVTSDTGINPLTKTPSLFAGENYFVRNLGHGSYSFYDTEPNALASPATTGRVDLLGNVTAGIFAAPRPTSTNISAAAETVTFTSDPKFPTGTLVQVTSTGGGLIAGANYVVRNHGGGTYSFYDSAINATAGSVSTVGRVNLTGNITAGIFSPTAKGRDTDRDGLDDRFEALIGWAVTTPQRTYRVYSSPNRADSNFDAPKPGVDSDGDMIEDRLEYSGTDLYAAPAGWDDKNADGLRDRFEVFQLAPLADLNGTPDYVLDPNQKDTDQDGINDGTEIIGFKVTPIDGSPSYYVVTDPISPFTDSDTFSDGLERLLGLDPTNGNDTDEDGDGLPDLVEMLGWTVYVFQVSTVPYQQGAYAPGYQAGIAPNATDLVADAVDFLVANDPGIHRYALAKVTGGGLAEDTPYFLGRAAEQLNPTKVRYRLYQSPADAAAGTERGALDLTSGITSIRIAVESRQQSRTDSVDSDNDGLTDYEEFFLGTDPSSADSDRDGIEDRSEYLGFELGHEVGGANLGFIKTDPLDADTDNDKRSDGAEAEHIDNELARWVVRVKGQTPYRAFSNPLIADADYDGVVDGDEFNLNPLYPTHHSDPNNGDTDGDGRDDGVERGVSNPLAVDTRVTVVAESFTASTLAQGKYDLEITVRPPGSGVAGLNPTAVTVFETSRQVGKIGIHNFQGNGTPSVVEFFYKYYNSNGVLVSSAPEVVSVNGQLTTTIPYDGRNSWGQYQVWLTAPFDPGVRGVPVNARFFVAYRDSNGVIHTASEELVYTGSANPAQAAYQLGGGGFSLDGIIKPTVPGTTPLYPTGAPGWEFAVSLPQSFDSLAPRSYSFGMANDERFSIEGTLTYYEGNSIDPYTVRTVKLGGLEGARASQIDSNNESTTLRPVFSWMQVADKFIEDYYFDVIVNGTSIGRINFYYIVG